MIMNKAMSLIVVLTALPARLAAVPHRHPDAVLNTPGDDAVSCKRCGTPVVTLSNLTRAGFDATHLLQSAAAAGPLPDDHPAAALWWRILDQLPETPNQGPATPEAIPATRRTTTRPFDQQPPVPRSAKLSVSRWAQMPQLRSNVSTARTRRLTSGDGSRPSLRKT